MNEERTHPATEKQRQRFHDRGEIARSRDLSSSAVFTAGAGALVLAFGFSGSALVGLCQNLLANLGQPLSCQLAVVFSQTFARATAPVLGACFVGALGVGLIQMRGQFGFQTLKVDASKLNPLPRLRQMFASVETLVSLAVSFLKVAVISALSMLTLKQKMLGLLNGEPASLQTVLHQGGELFSALTLRAGCAMVIIGLVDYAINWVKLERKMRMTTQELRDDMKEEQGDPQIRMRRRRRQLELSRQRSLKDAPKADVVLVNPTHFAVAILYRADRMAAPRVVAKGVDRQAARIRALARQHRVPVISEPPLTRLLYKRVPVGKQVPVDLYQAVAVVLSFVYRQRGRLA